MFRIGCVNIDTSHPKTFAKKMKELKRGKYVAIYNDGFRRDEEVEAFLKENGLEKRCKTIEELVDMVDICFIHDCNWDKHVQHAMPFIKAGKPVEQYCVTWNNGIKVIYQVQTGVWQPFNVIVTTNKSIHHFFGVNREQLYDALLGRIFDYMVKNKIKKS